MFNQCYYCTLCYYKLLQRNDEYKRKVGRHFK
jgi:hypothetical protein